MGDAIVSDSQATVPPYPYICSGCDGDITPSGAAFVAQQVLRGNGFTYTWGSTLGNSSGSAKFSDTAAGKIQEIKHSEEFGHPKPTTTEEMSADEFAAMLQKQWYFRPLADAVVKKYITDRGMIERPPRVFPSKDLPAEKGAREWMMILSKEEKARVKAGCEWGDLSWDERLAKIEEVML
jgi:hypothetical protein